MVYENLLAKQFFKVHFCCLIKCFGGIFAGEGAVILLITSNFLTNVRFHSGERGVHGKIKKMNLTAVTQHL